MAKNPMYWTIYTEGTKQELIKSLRLVSKLEGNLKVFEKFWMNTTPDAHKATTRQLSSGFENPSSKIKIGQ